MTHPGDPALSCKFTMDEAVAVWRRLCGRRDAPAPEPRVELAALRSVGSAAPAAPRSGAAAVATAAPAATR